MFTASYPASFLPEEGGRGYHVRFLAGRISRGEEIPPPSKLR